MVRCLTTTAVLALACCTAFPAFSQDLLAERAALRGQMSTVQSSFTSTVPLDETSDIASQQVESLRAFYKMAATSCVDVLATVADSCEIYRLTTSVNVMETATKGRRLTVNGNITMKVKFKDAADKTAQ